MGLQIKLSEYQVHAASTFWQDYLHGWQRADNALENLREALPNFSREECLIKAVAINAIYGTGVLAIVPMGEHIFKILDSTKLNNSSLKLVDLIAALPLTQKRKAKRFHTSFASKFCHFFVGRERFPIYDDAASQALILHLGKYYEKVKIKSRRYQVFCGNFDHLRREARLLTCSTTRQIDHYLWITGMYKRWLRNRNKNEDKILVNTEMRELFANPSQKVANLLRTILPGILHEAL